MMPINVLLSGRLRIDGYGQGHALREDGTFRLWVRHQSTVTEVIQGLGVPAERVVMVMLNGRQCNASATLKQGDRVVLVPDDVASLWRALGRSNLGLGIGYDS